MIEANSQKEERIMKLLHYFITEQNYNPIILQGVQNEVWLENLNSDYKIIRIVSNYIHNNEQLEFDIFKTKRVVNKIKKKTLSLNMNVLSIFTSLGDNVSLQSYPHLHCVYFKSEEDLVNDTAIKNTFPNLLDKIKFKEKGYYLFSKLTTEINKHGEDDSTKYEQVFKQKKPYVTYILIAINVLLFFIPTIFGFYDEIVNNFCTWGPIIRTGQYYRLITGAFLHAQGSAISLLSFHLLFNCYALYVIGGQVESYMGRVKYLIIYFFSILTASLLSIIFNNVPSIGASGAIFGLLGALLYFGYHYRIYLGNVLKSQIIPLIVLNLVLGFASNGIDNFAHIGGLIGGIAISVALGIKYKTTKFEQINGVIVAIILFAFLIYMAFVYGV